MNESRPDGDQRMRIVEISLDERTVVRRSPDVEHERAVAIYDLIEENFFAPVDCAEGPYNLHLSSGVTIYKTMTDAGYGTVINEDNIPNLSLVMASLRLRSARPQPTHPGLAVAEVRSELRIELAHAETAHDAGD